MTPVFPGEITCGSGAAAVQLHAARTFSIVRSRPPALRKVNAEVIWQPASTRPRSCVVSLSTSFGGRRREMSSDVQAAHSSATNVAERAAVCLLTLVSIQATPQTWKPAATQRGADPTTMSQPIGPFPGPVAGARNYFTSPPASTRAHMLSGLNLFIALANSAVFGPRSFWNTTPSWLTRNVITPDAPHFAG